MSRVRTLLLASLAGGVVWSCTDGPGPTDGAGRSAPLDIVPRFQLDPSTFSSAPIDRIRIIATDVETSRHVAMLDVVVDAIASQWVLDVGIDLGDAESMEVTVEIELLSGGSVQWSGRAGPITVPTGPNAAQQIDVYRGPLDNLDVVSLDITGAPSQLLAGAARGLTAEITLVAGSTADPVVFWASSDPAVATVTSEGPDVTLTAVTSGTTDIIAAAGPAFDELTLEVLEGPPPGFDALWEGNTSDWNDPSNWSTDQVPQTSDNVFIPATAVDPIISSTSVVEVADLAVAPGATLTISDVELYVSGDLQADGPIVGSLGVGMTGNGTTVSGTIETILQVSGTSTAGGPLTVDFLESWGAGASFDVGGQTVVVGTELLVGNGGVLRMTAPEGDLTATNATFEGGSTDGLLTAGTLRVLGDFVAGDNLPTTFSASGSHTVVFQGSQSQTIELAVPGVLQQHFQNLTFDQPNLVFATSDVVARGVVTVVDGTVGGDGFTLSVGGGLDDPAGGLAFNDLRLVGDVAALPADLFGPVFVDAAVSWPNDATVPADLTINGSLDVSTMTLAVDGSIFSNGVLTVPTGGTLSAIGTLVLASASTLHVDGTLTADGGCVDNGATIIGTGSHPCGGPQLDRSWVGGDGGGANAWNNANNWLPAGVPQADDAVLIPATGFQPVMSSSVSIGSLIVAQGVVLNQSGFTLTVARDVMVSGSVAQGLTVLDDVSATPYVVFGMLDDVQINAPRTLGGALTLAGSLDVRAALSIEQHTAIVNGDLIVHTASGAIIMTKPDGGVDVYGSALFDGAGSAGNLTEGVIQVLGDFTAASTHSPTSFQSTGTLVALYAYTGIQTVTFDNPGIGGQHFADLYVIQAGQDAALVFASNTLVTGSLTASNSTFRQGGAVTLVVQGTLTLDVVTFDGLPLRLESNVVPTAHTVDGVLFTNMPATSNHLYVQVPGAGSPMVINSPVFQTTPGGGFYHLEVINAVPLGQLLLVSLTSPTPSPPPAAAFKAGANAEVIWP
jgi:hypothetical protein